jgi:hypothetical protein
MQDCASGARWRHLDKELGFRCVATMPRRDADDEFNELVGRVVGIRASMYEAKRM